MQEKRTMNKRNGVADTDGQRISCRISFQKALRCRKTALSRGIRRFSAVGRESAVFQEMRRLLSPFPCLTRQADA